MAEGPKNQPLKPWVESRFWGYLGGKPTRAARGVVLESTAVWMADPLEVPRACILRAIPSVISTQSI
jgi:hypothetical protein